MGGGVSGFQVQGQNKMLSPGQYYKSVPTDPVENVKWRCDILSACAESAAARGLVRKMCSQDIIFDTALMVWQFNPRKKGKEAIGPFIPWDFQIDALLKEPADEHDEDNRGLLWCYENNQDVVVEKSRDMGISWLMLIMQDWLCRHHKYVKSLNISKNAEAVDDKDPDSLFWKIRFMHQWMPDWFKGPIVENQMFFAFEQTKSYITGTASTSAAGVSGRASTIFIDEFPRIKEDTAVRAGTASTSDSRFFNGTHQGTATEFFKLTQTPEIVKFVFHWSQHPDKNKGLYRWNAVQNRPDIIDKTYEFPERYKFDTTGKPDGGPFPGLRSPWYDKKVISIGSDVEAAQELDINPSGSVSQFFQPNIIRKLALEFCRRPEWEGRVDKQDNTYRLVEMVGHQPDEPAPLKLWMRPDSMGRFPPATYKIACDLSQGIGKTNSCVTIFNADIGERVGEYVNPRIYPEHLAPLVIFLCKFFVAEDEQTAELIWESGGGPGATFGLKVAELGYRRIYWNTDETNPKRFRKLTADRPGWNPEKKAKKLILSAYRFALQSRDFLNLSDIAMEETLLFQLSPDGNTVYHSGSLDKRDPSGAGENHGDRVIADALAWLLSQDHAKRAKATLKQEGPPELSWLWRREFNKNKAKRLERRH